MLMGFYGVYRCSTTKMSNPKFVDFPHHSNMHQTKRSGDVPPGKKIEGFEVWHMFLFTLKVNKDVFFLMMQN